jgi:hypothetical protein
MVPTILIAAPDLLLPGMLEAGGLTATATNTGGLGSALLYKAGALLVVVDEAQVQVLLESPRHDVRAVAIVNPRSVPSIFPSPVVAVVERPVEASRVMAAIRIALGTLDAWG